MGEVNIMANKNKHGRYMCRKDWRSAFFEAIRAEL
jgi:hypothetical protein